MSLKKETQEHIDKIQKGSKLLMKMPVPYEPMKKNRWLIRFPSDLGIQEWWLSSAQRPKLNHGFWSSLLGYDIGDMTLVFRDPIGQSLGNILLDLFEKKSKIDFEIEMLDPTGVVIEKWGIGDSKIIELDFGTLDYSDDSLAEIIVKFKPGNIKMK